MQQNLVCPSVGPVVFFRGFLLLIYHRSTLSDRRQRFIGRPALLLFFLNFFLCVCSSSTSHHFHIVFVLSLLYLLLLHLLLLLVHLFRRFPTDCGRFPLIVDPPRMMFVLFGSLFFLVSAGWSLKNNDVIEDQ